jgi:hypothetical protein
VRKTAAPRRKFNNISVPLPDGEIILGTHKANNGTVTVKLRLPGEWSVDQLFRGAKDATKSVLVITQKN